MHEGNKVWDTLAIAEYLNEVRPKSGLLPANRTTRAHCRSICDEMHSDFSSLRSALPMNLKRVFPGHKVWTRAIAEIERVTGIWKECLTKYGGPFMFGKRSMADAMYAPVVTRFVTYDVKLDPLCAGYAKRILALPEMIEWIAAAKHEPEEIVELDMEFWRTPAVGAPAHLQGVGSGTRHGPSTPTDVKSAGPTTSRYSMSGE